MIDRWVAILITLWTHSMFKIYPMRVNVESQVEVPSGMRTDRIVACFCLWFLEKILEILWTGDQSSPLTLCSAQPQLETQEAIRTNAMLPLKSQSHFGQCHSSLFLQWGYSKYLVDPGDHREIFEIFTAEVTYSVRMKLDLPRLVISLVSLTFL